MKELISDRDSTSTPIYFIELSDEGYTGRLAADTELTLTVPATARRAIISGDDYWFVKADGSITLPTEGQPFAKTNAHLAFDAINVQDVTTLHLKARNAMDISVAFYGFPES